MTYPKTKGIEKRRRRTNNDNTERLYQEWEELVRRAISHGKTPAEQNAIAFSLMYKATTAKEDTKNTQQLPLVIIFRFLVNLPVPTEKPLQLLEKLVTNLGIVETLHRLLRVVRFERLMNSIVLEWNEQYVTAIAG